MLDLNELIDKTAKTLPVFLLLDNSGSMSGSKIATLNQCVREMIKDFQSERLTEVKLELCIITFGAEGARLHTDLSLLKDVDYEDLVASGSTPLGGALTIASSIINDKEKVSGKGYRPVVVLVSDGYPNDNWQGPLNTFLTEKRTKKCEKWALGIGDGYDKDMLQQFLGNDEAQVFDASAAKEISKFFKLVTLSTIARTKSQNPNLSVNYDDLVKQMDQDLPTFEFGLDD